MRRSQTSPVVHCRLVPLVAGLVLLAATVASGRLRRLPPLDEAWPLASVVDLADPDSSVEPLRTPNEPLTSDGAAAAYERWWTLDMLPQGLIYSSYLAGEKESRMRGYWSHDAGDGWIWDITLGGRIGLWRYGTNGDERPQGWQLDIEGAAIPRLDMEHENELMSADFRFGVPFTYGNDFYQTKIAYYHLSSHVGDEFLQRNPGFSRLNFSRDVLVWGHSFTPCDDVRLYVEAGWAFFADFSDPWEFQLGVDWAPTGATGPRGAPFVAVNGHLREEVGFGGNVVVQAGWAWRRSPASGMVRYGLEYFGGKSDQFSFLHESEQKLGLGLWYDY